MIDERNDDGGDKDSVLPRPAAPAPIDRASESIVNPTDPHSGGRAPPPKQTSAIESGEIEISPASFSPPSSASAAVSSSPASLDPPPSTIIANAMGRGRQKLSIGAIVGITCGVLVVLVGLTLLLFR